MRQVILHRGEDGKWVAEIPSLPGCISEGATPEEAISNITEAAELWIESLRDSGESIPPDDGSAQVRSIRVA